ncbi:MAG: hypothetical protein OHK0023_20400 [Anaerolineae bacterium]
MSERVKAALAQVLTRPPQYALEIGCGTQPFTDFTLIHLDWDGEALRRMHSKLRRLCADAGALPFSLNSLDLILIRHPDLAAHPISWQRALQHLAGYLRAGALLCTSCYEALEWDWISEWVDSLSLASIPISDALLPPVPLSGADRYIHLFRKVGF